jgi:hypothetical protein
MLITHGLRAAGGGSNPTFIGVAGTIVDSAASVSANLPSGIAAGDLLVMFVSVATNTGSTITTPTGWTQFLAQVTGQRSGAYYKVATGSEGATQTVSLSDNNNTASFNVLLIRNQGATYTVGAFAASDTVSPITNAGITPPDPGLLLGFWGIRANGSTAVTVTGGPSGMSLANIASGYTGNDAITNAVYYQDQAAGATGTREITTSGTINTSRSLLLQIS